MIGVFIVFIDFSEDQKRLNKRSTQKRKMKIYKKKVDVELMLSQIKGVCFFIS